VIGKARSLLVAAALIAGALVPSTATAGTAAMPALGVNDVAMRAFGATDQRLQQVATAAENLGSSSGVPVWVWRMELAWSDVQPGLKPNPPFDWARYDRIYAALRAHGIKPLWVVMRAPNWARNPLDLCRPAPGGQCPPADGRLGEWRNFVKNAVLRYPQSAGIEVWNEPNTHQFWGTFVNPPRYARVLGAAYLGVQDAEDQLRSSLPAGWDVPVLSGGPANPKVSASIWRAAWGEMSAPAWLNAVYDTGERRFDALSAHAYPHPQTVPPDLASPPLLNGLATLAAIRDARGDSNKPIWLTEIGYHTAGSWGSFGPPTDSQHQGEFLRCAYGLLIDNPDNIAAFVINHLVDQSTQPIDQEGSFGLLANDLSFKAPPPNDGYSILQSYFAGTPTRVTGCG
jgi:hypothetical protein